MKEFDFDLHVGQDYGLTYIIEDGGTYDGYTAIMKVRRKPEDAFGSKVKLKQTHYFL